MTPIKAVLNEIQQNNIKYQEAINAFAETNLNYHLCLDFIRTIKDELRRRAALIGGIAVLEYKIEDFLKNHKS